MASIKGLTIEIAGNVTPLNKALGDVNSKSRDLKSELRDVDRLLKLDPTNTELLAQKQKILAESIQNTEEKLGKLKEAEKQAQDQFAKGEISEEQYRALQREVVKTEQDLAKLEKQAKDFGTTSERELKKVQKSFEETGEKAKKLGGTMTKGVTAPILAVGAAATLAFKEVDDAVDTITTKTGATGEQMKGFEQSFKNVFSSMPVDAMAAGEAIGELNTQFGFTGEELENASRQALKFAEINGQDVTSTAIQSKGAMEAYGLEAEDLSMVLDSVTKAAQDTGVSTDKIFDVITKGAPQLQAMGLDMAQAAAVMGRFEQKGIESTKAVSYLTRAQVTWAKEGKNVGEGLEELTERINASTSETEQLTIAAEYFGTKGGPMMLDAIKRGALDLDDFGDAAQLASGAVSSTFEETLDPIDHFKTSLNNLKIVGNDVSATIQTSLTPIIEALTAKLQQFSEWFQKLSPEMKTFITTTLLIVAAIGPLIVLVGTVIQKVGVIMGLLPGLKAGIMAVNAVLLANPLGVVIALAAALAAGIFYLWKTNEDFRNALIGIWDTIKSTIGGAIDFITKPIDGLISKVKSAIDWLKRLKFWEKDSDTSKKKAPTPGMAAGGTITSGTSFVGERGPELLTLSPGAAKVTPLGHGGTGDLASDIANAIGNTLAMNKGGAETLNLTVNVGTDKLADKLIRLNETALRNQGTMKIKTVEV